MLGRMDLNIDIFKDANFIGTLHIYSVMIHTHDMYIYLALLWQTCTVELTLHQHLNFKEVYIYIWQSVQRIPKLLTCYYGNNVSGVPKGETLNFTKNWHLRG